MRNPDIAVIRRVEQLTGAPQWVLARVAGVSLSTWSRWACHGGATVVAVHRVIHVWDLDAADVFGVIAHR